MREYMIYCDESLSKGTYYSHFYGGVLVRSKDFHQVNTALEEMKTQLNLFGEIKWTKVTAPYLEKYKRMMDVFFGFVKEKKLKMRVMFQETSQIVPNYGPALQYHLLYYQFIKHAFGLAYHKNNPVRPTKIKLFFDEIPDTRSQNDDFKAHLSYLQELSLFHNAKIVLKPRDIAEIDSHKHPIQQCMDIVLGAMAFHMNKMYLPASEGGPGTPGKKTQAKEELFQHILTLIKDANGDAGFNIYENTQPETGRGRWRVPYRHWKFVPAEFREKKAKKKKSSTNTTNPSSRYLRLHVAQVFSCWCKDMLFFLIYQMFFETERKATSHDIRPLGKFRSVEQSVSYSAK